MFVLDLFIFNFSLSLSLFFTSATRYQELVAFKEATLAAFRQSVDAGEKSTSEQEPQKKEIVETKG
jgi:hypothetical protein